MAAHEKWEQGHWEIVGRLLDRIIPHLGEAECTLIADRGLAGFALVQLCRDRQWHYLVRVCKEQSCRRQMRGKWSGWTPFSQIILKAGHQWFGRMLLWQDDPIETSVSAVWEPDHAEAWWLISDQSARWRRLSEYTSRMRVASTFQESQSRGWNLEASMTRDRVRLDRLLLALFLARWWLTHLAASCIHQGQRARFDRSDRRDKGLFRGRRVCGSWTSYAVRKRLPL